MTQQLVQDEPRLMRARARLGMVLSGRWTIEALLGAGGMAAVYSAVHRNGKRVAVKMLHGDLSHDQEVRRRFLLEGYAANTVQHDGAVSVLDDDVAADGSAFIVMELLEGETLAERWERLGRTLPVRDVLAVVDQLLDVLVAAHGKNVVHRDIKPENVFVTRGGLVKVLDFGIARVFERETAGSSATRAGMVMGTPAFMAPEQARARWDEVDGRTDLWAVGATMYTLLSGHYVHESPSDQEQVISSATRRASPLASVAPDVPAVVAALVDRALAFRSDERWPDAVSMQRAVRAALDSLGGPGPFATASARRPATAGALASGIASHITAATAIDTVTGSALSAWNTERDLRAAEAARLRASVASLLQRHADAKRRAAEAQGSVEAGRAERSSLELWFKRKVGTRTAAVEEAQKEVKQRLIAVAKRAVLDRGNVGAELDPARKEIGKLELAAASAARDVRVHEAALVSYDARSLRQGAMVAAALVLLFVVAPIVWRAVRVVEPPSPRVNVITEAPRR